MKRMLSLILTLCVIATMTVSLPMEAKAEMNIQIGDYLQMGTYYEKPILWRCVDIDENGPLMLSDKILCIKPMDANGTNTSGSHGRGYYDIYSSTQGYYRQRYGSNYWADSNMRSWLNSTASAGNVTWLCGNPPDRDHVYNGYNNYADEAGFLSNFTQKERNAIKEVTQKSILDGTEHSTGYPNVLNPNYHQASSSIDSVLQNYDTAFSEQVTDTIFLPDVKQIYQTYQNGTVLGSDYYIGKPTEECVKQNVNKAYPPKVGEKWNFWLRTPLGDDNRGSMFRYVNSVGSVTTDSDGFNGSYVGVRPAFYLNLETAFVKSGSGTEAAPYIVEGKTPFNPSIGSAIITYNETTYELLSQAVNVDKESDAEVSVKVTCEGETENLAIYLSQDTATALELVNGEEKTFKPAEVFTDEKDIYLLILDRDTGESFSKKTRLKIVDKTANGEWLPDGEIEGLNFKLGKETGFTIPDSVAVFGGTEIKWDFDFIPISVEYDREDENKINVVFGTNILHLDGEDDKWFKDFDFKKYKEELKKAASKQGRSLKQLRNDFKMSDAYKMNLFGGKVIGGGEGKSAFDGELAGYAEMKIIDGYPQFVEGQLCFEVEVSYTYQGQLFIWVVPIYYEIGGGAGAGFEGKMIDIDPEGFTPEFEAYFTAKIMANLGAGVGVAKVATVGVNGEGSLNLKTAVHEKYLKSWGEGEASFKVKVFGKEVAKKNFAKGDFLIYETGNANGLISSSAVKFAAAPEEEGIYSGIDMDKVYENESRAYAQSPAEWYGDIPPISLMSTEYSNQNLQLLAGNVYTEAAPMMCNIDGQKVMVMLWDDEDRDAVNRTMAVYSVYDEETGLWSYPVPVHDDGTADFYPCFCDGYLVWQNEKSLLDDSMTLTEIAELGEICVSRWNGNGFDDPIVLTENDSIDTQPVVAASGTEVSVVWTTNSENDIIGISGTNSILKSTLQNDGWSKPETVKDNLTAIVNLSAGYTNSGWNIAYVADGDNDLQTITDRDICILSENGEYKMTDNEVLDSNPMFVDDMIYYYSNGNIEYQSVDGEEKNTVFEQSKSGLTDAFTVGCNENGETAIWWAKSTEDATEIYCVLYKDGEWSDEIQISETGNQSKYPAGLLEEDGSMYLAYNNSIWQDGTIVQSDLYTINLIPSYDIALTDAYIDEDSMIVYATVKNTGELNIDSYTVTLTDGEVNAQKTITEALKAGESTEIVIEYSKPENLDKRTIVLTASTEEEEYDLENNSVELTVGSCDVNVAEVRSYEGLPKSTVVGVISNDGYSDTGEISVSLRKQSADGTVIETQTIKNLSAGESEEVSFEYSITEDDSIQWYVTAETENKEISLGNNDLYFINNYGASVPDYSHEILRCNFLEDSMVVNTHIDNNTGTDLVAVSQMGVYDKKGRLRVLKKSDANVAKYDSATIDFTFEDYTYVTGDYVRLFLWYDFGDAAPICQQKQSNIQ